MLLNCCRDETEDYALEFLQPEPFINQNFDPAGPANRRDIKSIILSREHNIIHPTN